MNWLSKYKPTDYNQIIGQDNVIQIIQNNIQKLPHMIFYGPPGVSKTSIIDITAHKIYGKNKSRNTLFLNASDERGIDTVRNKIKQFAQQKIYSTTSDYTFKFKLIILDEADSMTSEAQTALRRIMENYSNITRFCFICNYVNKIISPISSRCAIFRFKKISPENIQKRLTYICQQENCSYLQNIIPSISQKTNGDLRQSIILLESIYNCTDKLLNLFNHDYSIILSFQNFNEMKTYIDNIFYKQSDIQIFMLNIKQQILLTDNFSDYTKSELLIKLNKCQNNIFQNCNEKLQLYLFFSNFIQKPLSHNPHK